MDDLWMIYGYGWWLSPTPLKNSLSLGIIYSHHLEKLKNSRSEPETRHMQLSWNRGISKSSISGFSFIKHPAMGVPPMETPIGLEKILQQHPIAPGGLWPGKTKRDFFKGFEGGKPPSRLERWWNHGHHGPPETAWDVKYINIPFNQVWKRSWYNCHGHSVNWTYSPGKFQWLLVSHPSLEMFNNSQYTSQEFYLRWQVPVPVAMFNAFVRFLEENPWISWRCRDCDWNSLSNAQPTWWIISR